MKQTKYFYKIFFGITVCLGFLNTKHLYADQKNNSYNTSKSNENKTNDNILINISNDSTEGFINTIAPQFQKICKGHDNIYVSLMIAQAILESNNGNSMLSMQNHNLFNITGSYKGKYITYNSKEYRSYDNYCESAKDYINLISNGTTWDTNLYSKAWKTNSKTVEDAAQSLQEHYSTDSDYSEKLINIIHKYNLQKYDEQGLGKVDNGSPDKFIKSVAPYISEQAKKNKLYPSLAIATAMVSSNNGNSDICKNNYNMFSITGKYGNNSVVNDKGIFRSYSNYEESVKDYVNLLLNGTTWNHSLYRRTWIDNSSKVEDAAQSLQGVYSSEPSFAQKIINVIHKYHLTDYDDTSLDRIRDVNHNSIAEFIKSIAPYVSKIAYKNNLYASIILSQAILESGYGNSDISINNKNLFNIRGNYQGRSVTIKSGIYRSYTSYEDSINDYVNLMIHGTTWNSKLYCKTWKSNSADINQAVSSLQGIFATDPEYAKKVIKLINDYNLTTYDSISTDVDSEDGSTYKYDKLPPYNNQEYPGAECYAWGNCTRYAYNRIKQLGGNIGTHMGNGGEWGENAKSQGYYTCKIPHVGFAVSFPPGVAGSSSVYGHVAIVEEIYDDGSILVSEMNVRGPNIVSNRVISKFISQQATYIQPK